MTYGRSTSIRAKLIAAFAIVLVLLLLFAVTAVGLQLRGASRAAVLEAEHVAEAIANTGIDNAIDNPKFLQQYVESLQKLYQRDIFIVDVHMRVVADTDRTEIGSVFSKDPGKNIDQTLLDGQTRTFVEPDVSADGPSKQVVVPLRRNALDPSSPIIGGVVFEYTHFFNTLMAEAWVAIEMIGAATGLLVVLTMALGIRMTASISKPLRELQGGVTAIAAGDFGKRVQIASGDEIGRLGAAYNQMAEDLQASHASLLERAEELSRTNALLQQEMEKQRLAAERIEYLAFHDSLTALPNRSMFSRLLQQGISQARRYNRQLAVFFIDLDRFKQINDTLGHDAGDLLLQDVAKRLKQCLRDSDTVARLGGDEFVVLLPELDEEKQAETVAHKILTAMGKPFSLSGHELRVTSSVGVSTYPKDGKDEQTLMKNADIAMYQAKERGRNNFQFYSEELNANSFERLALESSLRRALERDELQLYYQAKKDFSTGGISGMEALLRWQHPDLGMVMPMQFIPVAEETGLIVPIGKWVLRTACLQNVAWRKQGLSNLVVAVNLSPRQFSDDNLLGDITSTLQETGMDPTLLELEITESMIMHNAQKTGEVLTALKKMGIRIAIDDFGTGYSSLSNIKQFPIDTLKIDGSFIRDLASNTEDRGITEAIIAMGKTLNLHLIAECVETKEQADFLREHACDEFQGFYFSKPVPADQFSELIRAQRMVNAVVSV